MPEQDLIVRHHEVHPGDRVNLSELLKTLMSYEILAKKALAFMWAAHPSIPLWKDVPPKPQPPPGWPGQCAYNRERFGRCEWTCRPARR